MSSTESSEESEEVELLTKPIFIKKKTSAKQLQSEETSQLTDDKVLDNLDNIRKIIEETPQNEQFDGIDDNDDDEQAEYEKWRIREFNRYQRDRESAIEKELEKEETLKRKK